MTFALIPAAGSSRRMGQPKLALPLGDGTVLGHVIYALKQAGVEHILVVVGPQVTELAPLAEAAGAFALSLVQPTADMRATVEQGLSWLEEHFHPHDNDSWLLVPGDHPTLDSKVVERLLRTYRENRHYSIIIPTFRERRGHPALLGWKHVAGIREQPADQGINVYLRTHADVTLEVAVDSADILVDLNTRGDYDGLRHNWPHRSTPPAS
jgi:molybdenum cofactor cytidylyltransferase